MAHELSRPAGAAPPRALARIGPLPAAAGPTNGRTLARTLSKALPKYLTADQVRAMIGAAKSARDRLLLELLWQTGLRVSEALAVTAGDVDFAGEVLRANTLKRRGHVRTIPLRPALLGELARWIASRKIGDELPLFGITRQRVFAIVRECGAAAAIPRDLAHPHTLRHSFAVACVHARVPVLVLNEWLGHASLEATLIYTKVLAADSRQYIEEVRFS